MFNFIHSFIHPVSQYIVKTVKWYKNSLSLIAKSPAMLQGVDGSGLAIGSATDTDGSWPYIVFIDTVYVP